MIEEIKQSLTDTLKQVFSGPDALPEDAISLLKQDHSKVEELFKKFEETDSKIARRSLLDEIITELTVHASLEEKFIYPLLFTEETEDKTKEAFEEHHVVKLLLTELDSFGGGEDNIKAKVKVLSEMVKHHIKEEELDLLPKLKDQGVDLDELGATLKKEKKNFLRQLDTLKKQAAMEALKAIGAGNGSSKAAAKTAAKPKIEKPKSKQQGKTAASKKSASSSKSSSTAASSKAKSSSLKASKKTATAGGAKKGTAKKAAAKKPVAKKPTAKKAATTGGAKKTAAKKATAKKPATKKTATKKSSPKMMASGKSKTASMSKSKTKKSASTLKKAS